MGEIKGFDPIVFYEREIQKLEIRAVNWDRRATEAMATADMLRDSIVHCKATLERLKKEAAAETGEASE